MKNETEERRKGITNDGKCYQPPLNNYKQFFAVELSEFFGTIALAALELTPHPKLKNKG